MYHKMIFSSLFTKNQSLYKNEEKQNVHVKETIVKEMIQKYPKVSVNIVKIACQFIMILYKITNVRYNISKV